jgi:pimeloyl-ACP methyl ester carboxylesterase
MTTTWLQVESDPDERLAADLLPGAGPAYVWLHAFGASRVGEHSSALFAYAAARGRAAVRFDFRGHGDSTGRIGATTTRDLVADTATVLAKLAAANLGPAILVGHSLGALIAAMTAAERPASVHGLVLMAPSFGFRTVLRRCLGPDGRLRTPDGRSFPVHQELLADADGLDEGALPARLTMPVLAVHGDRDDVVSPAATQAFTAAVPHAQKDCWLVAADHRLSGLTDHVLARADRLFASVPTS